MSLTFICTNILVFFRDTASQTLKNFWSLEETVWGWGDVLGLWDGNPVKLDCDDHYTTIDVINSFD